MKDRQQRWWGLYLRARRRVVRRAQALIAYMDEFPTRGGRAHDPDLRRLDDLIGEAERLSNRLHEARP